MITVELTLKGYDADGSPRLRVVWGHSMVLILRFLAEQQQVAERLFNLRYLMDNERLPDMIIDTTGKPVSGKLDERGWLEDWIKD